MAGELLAQGRRFTVTSAIEWMQSQHGYDADEIEAFRVLTMEYCVGLRYAPDAEWCVA